MRPPKEFEGKPGFHWVLRHTFENVQLADPMAWVADRWFQIGTHISISPDEASAKGWVWLGVAEPPISGWETRG